MNTTPEQLECRIAEAERCLCDCAGLTAQQKANAQRYLAAAFTVATKAKARLGPETDAVQPWEANDARH